MAYTDRATKRITLSDPQYWVDLYTNQTYGQLKDLQDLQKLEGMSASDALLQSMIANWNIDNADGILPVDLSSLATLTREDAEIILAAINAVFEEAATAKKSSSSKSPAPSVAAATVPTS